MFSMSCDRRAMGTHRLVALVATLLTEGLFVEMDKPAVPRREVSRVVDGQGLLDMGHDKVVKLRRRVSRLGPDTCSNNETYPRLCTCCDASRSARR